MTLKQIFPFEYIGGGYFRRKGAPKHEPAETLHGMQAIEYVLRRLQPPPVKEGLTRIDVAIDIDGTWTDESVRPLLAAMLMQGAHEESAIVFVTRRSVVTDEERERLGIPHSFKIFCLGTFVGYKRDYMRSLGYEVAVWIDNEPGDVAQGNLLSESRDEDL